MKKLVLIITIVMCNLYSGIAQSVTTPNGTTINLQSHPYNGLSKQQMDALEDYAKSYGGIVISLADDRYNCHTYAWGNRAIMGNMSDGNVSTFWDRSGYTGGGYKDVTGTSEEATASHVMYGTDHSGLGSSTSTYHESKWSEGCVVLHYPNNTPFSNPTAYYKLAEYTLTFDANGGNGGSGALPSPNPRTIIAGTGSSFISSAPSHSLTPPAGKVFGGWSTSNGTLITYNPAYRITSTHTLYALWVPPSITGSGTVYYSGEGYTLSNVSSGTVTWGFSAGAPFGTPPSGNPTKVSKTSPSGSGTATLTAYINGTAVATKSITAYSVDMTGPSSLYYGGTYSFSVPYVAGASYNWYGSDITLVSSNNNNASFYVPNGTATYGYANCTITYNGVTNFLFKSAPIY